MSKNKTYLAVDFGAESGRVIAGNFDGEKLSLEPVNAFPNGPLELANSMHWNTLYLYSEVLKGIHSASAKYGSSIQSVGVDTWGVDYGFIDASGHLTGVPYHYRDSRTDNMISKTHAIVPDAELFSRTGIQSNFFNTLYQLMAEVENDSKALASADQLLFTPDLINFWLTGVKASERTIASTSQLINQDTGTWDVELLGKLGIPTHMLGIIMEPGTILGQFTENVSKRTNTENLKVILVGSHDTASAVASVPAEAGYSYAFLSSGTWSLMGIENKSARVDEVSRLNGFTNEHGVCGTTRYLKNISGLWIIQECKRYWEQHGENLDYAKLTSLAEEAEPFTAIIDPDYEPFSGIGDMPNKIKQYCHETGQRVPESKGAILRTATEGLALKYNQVMDALGDVNGAPLDKLHIVGGGTQNKLLNQMTANAINKEVITGPIEATAFGNIIVQMMACGDISSLEEGRAIVKKSFDCETYLPQDVDQWDQARAKAKKLFK